MNRFSKPELIRTFTIWNHLARRDINSNYARTVLGPWWSASSLFITVVGITLSTTALSGNSAGDEAPRIAFAMAVWFLVSSILIEAASAFESDSALMLNSTFTEKTMIARLIWRNLIVFVHNWVVLLIVMVITLESVTMYFRAVIGLLFSGLFAALFLYYPSLYIARIGLRHRDSQIFIVSATQMGFFITPIFWDPPERGLLRYIFEANPFGWLIYSGKHYLLSSKIESDLVIQLSLVCLLVLLFGALINRKTKSIKKYL